jgi:hypothetical protein
MHKEGGSTVETPVEARAGFLDRPTLTVLLVSIGLTIGLFALVYIVFFRAVMVLGRKRDRDAVGGEPIDAAPAAGC